jgi:UDP-4-amino-4-deoxy-L-arabinose formyltransferase/UDP-glucuronic acid dehydrogenase (UDP-4-keto-hexauronic acid decarboxylating)
MKCVVFAYHDIGCKAIQTLHEMGEDIVGVFTHEDDPRENLWFGSVKKLSESLRIATYAPENPNTAEWVKKIKDAGPEIIFSFYYRKLLSDSILEIPPKGALNLHGSLLPRYRGRAPVNWVLVNGERETGLTLHYMTRKPDAGDIAAQKKVTIENEDTAFTLYKKLVPLARQILLETVPKLARGTAPRFPQDLSQASYFGGRKPQDGMIDWTKTSKEIYNLIRAVTHPYPGAFTFLNGKRIFLWQAKDFETGPPSKPGAAVSVIPFSVACGKGLLTVARIQSENGKELDGADWARENHIKPGDQFD